MIFYINRKRCAKNLHVVYISTRTVYVYIYTTTDTQSYQGHTNEKAAKYFTYKTIETTELHYN